MFNIFFLCFGAVAFAIFLAMVITRQSIPNGVSMVPPEDDLEKDAEIKRNIGLPELELLAEKLCKENGLVIKDRMTNKPTEIYWIAESKNDFFFGNYVLCLFLTDEKNKYARLTDLLEFKDFVKSMQSTKGFFFTNGYFTKDCHQPLEGPKVALYNRRKVDEELTRLKG